MSATSHHHEHSPDSSSHHESREHGGTPPTEDHDHNKYAGHSPEMFRDKFWLSLALTISVVIWPAHVQDILGQPVDAGGRRRLHVRPQGDCGGECSTVEAGKAVVGRRGLVLGGGGPVFVACTLR